MFYKDFKTSFNRRRPLENLPVVHEIDAIRNSVKNILTTRIGSVPGRPDFGSRLYLLVFNMLDAVTVRLAERYVREAIAKFEDRITVKEVVITKDEAYHKLMIQVRFVYRDNIGTAKTETVLVPLDI